MAQPVQSWLLLAYKVPRDPTANRVSVWRKLKRLGAVLLNDAAWVLPATPKTAEQFQWLAMEIKELGGEYTLWEAKLLLDGHGQDLMERFDAQVEAPYRKILTELKRKKADLAVLSRRYQQVRAQDYFHSELGRRVFETLTSAREAALK
ncbi:MAG: Chromate resistance protein ChrB [Gammaproteobacteria bacterium]